MQSGEPPTSNGCAAHVRRTWATLEGLKKTETPVISAVPHTPNLGFCRAKSKRGDGNPASFRVKNWDPYQSPETKRVSIGKTRGFSRGALQGVTQKLPISPIFIEGKSVPSQTAWAVGGVILCRPHSLQRRVRGTSRGRVNRVQLPEG